MDEENRARFQIGYAPDGYSGLRDALGKDERRMKLLDRAGLFSKNDRGHVYDKFRDRVMFPIFDRRGRVIAFGGRVFEKDDGPKYLNSPETALFHKGRELYGLWQVRQANQKIERLIVVEGYMDVVSLFQFGVTQAVATLGTATTPDHAELLFRNAPDVFFCFDGDAAGRRAGWKALESVLPRMKDGRQAFFLFLPDGEDPDTIVRKEGAEAFNERLKQATPLSQFFFDELTREINLGTLDGKARLAERAKPMLAQIPDGAFGDLMKQQLAQLTGLGGNAQSARAPMPQRQPQRTIQPVAKRSLVRGAIAVLLQQPSLALTLVASITSRACACRAWSCCWSCWGWSNSARTSAPAPCWNTSTGVRNRLRCIRWRHRHCPAPKPAGPRSCTTRWPSWRNSCWCNVWRSCWQSSASRVWTILTSTSCASC